MLLVCTKDAANPAVAWNRTSTWGEVIKLNLSGGQQAATMDLRYRLGELKPMENLCIVAYGGDNEIRSEEEHGAGCSWTAADIANAMLGAGRTFGNWSVPTPEEHSVTILFHLISKTPCNFLTNVMLEVLKAKTSNFGIASFGYTSEVSSTTALPGPFQLKHRILPAGMTSLIVGRL